MILKSQYLTITKHENYIEFDFHANSMPTDFHLGISFLMYGLCSFYGCYNILQTGYFNPNSLSEKDILFLDETSTKIDNHFSQKTKRGLRIANNYEHADFLLESLTSDPLGSQVIMANFTNKTDALQWLNVI